MATYFSFRHVMIAALIAAMIFFVSAPAASAQQFGQNQILPPSYLGDGFVISTSTSPSHKLTATSVDLAGSYITGILPLANGGTGANLSDPGADRIFFWDESDNASKFLTVGSGLSITGTTLSTSGGGITAIGPAGQTQTGGTITLATSTSATNGLTPSLVITGAGDVLTYTSSISGTLTVAGGGTGAATLTGVLKGNGTSAFTAAVDGTDFTLIDAQSCTNQVITAITAAGVSTCSSVSNAMLSNSTISGVSLGGTLAALTATDATLTFSGSYTGATARTVGINLGNANTWSATQTFGTILASVADFTAGVLRATYNAAFTPATNGDIGIDSTSNQFKYYSNSAVRVLGDGNFYPAFSYATTTAWTGTTTIALGPAYTGETWNGVKCFTDVGTLNVSFNDGTNRMNLFNASTTVGTVPLNSNNTFTSSEKRYVDIGTPATSPTKISCTVSKSLTAD